MKIECVYLLFAVGLDRMKVGYTADLVRRLRTIQTSCPAPILLLAVIRGGRAKEKELHKNLARCHAHGEWFHCDLDVAIEFRKLNNDQLLDEIKMQWAQRHFDGDIFSAFGNILMEMCQ